MTLHELLQTITGEDQHQLIERLGEPLTERERKDLRIMLCERLNMPRAWATDIASLPTAGERRAGLTAWAQEVMGTQ